MRFTVAAAALAAAIFASSAYGHEGHSHDGNSHDGHHGHDGIDVNEDQHVVAEEPVTLVSSVPLPSFTPSTVQAGFLEQFTAGWNQRWKVSSAKKKNSNGGSEEWAYIGQWSVEEPKVYKGMQGDKGLVVKTPAAHHAISALFPKTIDPKGKTLVIQYEVKLQQSLECGGAYLKLLRENKALHQDEFSDTTPYVIMFGPDKCGGRNKVHFIFNHKNPITGEYEEKHLKANPTAKIVKTTELYTLIIQPNNTFIIKENGEEVKTGSLLEDFEPAVNPSADIDDPEDVKPEDWVDAARIQDADATKPDDWDEDEPLEVIHEEAVKPKDWLEKEPLSVPDPETQKPEDWDDDEDGDWIAPQVPNPKCADVSGCGPWTKPMKANPKFVGVWRAPYIDNPAYKGPWAARKIPNPNFFEDKTPANFEPMGAIGFEIWTMQSEITFDNIYIGHSVADAERLAAETFKLKLPAEKAAEAVDKPKESSKKPMSPMDLDFFHDPITYVREKLDLFITIARQDPIQAVQFVPEIAGGIALIIATVIGLMISLMMAGSSPAVKKAATDGKNKVQVQAKAVVEKVVAAAATGQEAVKAEVIKRTGNNPKE